MRAGPCLSGELRSHAVEGAADDVVHIVVAVFREAATEEGAVFFFCEGSVFGVEGLVGGVVDGVVGFVAGVPVGGVFARDVSDGLGAEFKVFVLDDARVGDVAGGVIHHGDALVILFLEAFGLEAEAAVGEGAEPVAEVGVDGAGVDGGAGASLVAFSYGGGVVVFAGVDLDAGD